jgi:phenylpropionate dioxygenase-like ring-hydroxylating dioxygenase large terminal subunit
MFPLNAWYAAGWSAEIGRDLTPRTILGRAVVLYRTEAGEPVALADACWHRLVPLSLGRLRGDDLMCGYHGITFDPQGRCSFMPSQETINPSASVASFPVLDRHRLCWVWLGDAELADPALVPDLGMTSDPAFAGGGERLHLECDYRLVLDNLMDLTHETFLHGSSIGNAAVAEAPFTVEHTDTSVTVRRWMRGIPPPPAVLTELSHRFPGHYDGGPIDRWQVIRWLAPSTIVIDAGVAIAGTGAEDGDLTWATRGYVVNTISPETDHTANYYWLRLRDHSLDDEGFTAAQVKLVHGVFEEDRAMLNAQQKAIDAHPRYAFYNLNIDAGGMWVRRILARLVEAEAELVGVR